MGVVYLATRDDDQFQKRVAIKIVKLGGDFLGVLRRFRHERQILANLEHPLIARLLDGGTTPDGRPWIAMEYVEGLPIDRFCRERELSIEQRCLLVCQVCDAVAYAHRHLLVHRDLKPTNILIAEDGNPKLLDFGIARLLEDDEPGEAAVRAFSLSLTPDYASPEQMEGGSVTTASDVYSLGVVLHEVLTGVRPAQEPAPKARKGLPGDLDSILGMALCRDSSSRYSSAEKLAEDIHRHLEGFPVQACRQTFIYRSGKFLRRNRTAAAAAVVIASSILAGAVIDVRQARATQKRFDQLRGFARTVLVNLDERLRDIPGTTSARQALVNYVDDYLKQVTAQRVGDDTALATEFATTYLRLGEMQGDTPEAIASFEAGRLLLARQKMNPPDSLMLARLRVREGATMLDVGRAREGSENLEAGLTLADSLRNNTSLYPEADLVAAFANERLARQYRLQYLLPQAEERARRAIATCEAILRHGVQTKEVYQILTGARNVLGAVQRRQGHWKESMATYQEVLSETERRAQAEPASVSVQRQMARSHLILADMVSRMPGRDENLLRFHVRRAIALSQRLAELDPWDKTAQNELAQCLSGGAELLLQPEDAQETLGYLRRALPIFETLLKTEPGSRELQLDAALTEADMGEFLGRNGSRQQSIVWLRRGLLEIGKLVERDRSNLTNLMELIKVQRWLSLSLAYGGQKAEALVAARDAIANATLLAGLPGVTPETWSALPRAYAAMGATCDVIGEQAEAQKWYRAANLEWGKMIAKGFHPPDEHEVEDARRRASGTLHRVPRTIQ
jgi:tetratricopeptide (TPR) repeat protein